MFRRYLKNCYIFDLNVETHINNFYLEDFIDEIDMSNELHGVEALQNDQMRLVKRYWNTFGKETGSKIFKFEHYDDFDNLDFISKIIRHVHLNQEKNQSDKGGILVLLNGWNAISIISSALINPKNAACFKERFEIFSHTGMKELISVKEGRRKVRNMFMHS